MGIRNVNERFRRIGDVPSEVKHTMLKLHAVVRSLLFDRLAGALPEFEYPDCHAVSRAFAMAFPELEVCDGVVIICNEAGLLPGQHSWLRFKRYPDFGVDVAPCGSVLFMTFPNLIYFDRFAPFHRYSSSSLEVSARSEQCAEEFFFQVLEPIVKKCEL